MRKRPAFTLIELMVVVAIVGLLTTLIVTGVNSVFYQQRVRNTLNTMRTVQLGIDQFATVNPLAAFYDNAARKTFGPYIPYQLDDPTNSPPGSLNQPEYVSHAIEPIPPGGWNFGNDLRTRLYRDLGGPIAPGTTPSDSLIQDYVYFPRSEVRVGRPVGSPNGADGFDDNRALSAYLRVFVPDAFEQIPRDARRQYYPDLPANQQDYVNPSGTGGDPTSGFDGNNDGQPDWVDILGIHDAWGVPLDYMLHVKIKWVERRNRETGIPEIGYRVVERKPVLRSLGVQREVYDANVEALRQGGLQWRDLFEPERYIWSEELPQPRLDGLILVDPFVGALEPDNLTNTLVPRATGWVYGLERDAPGDATYIPVE